MFFKNGYFVYFTLLFVNTKYASVNNTNTIWTQLLITTKTYNFKGKLKPTRRPQNAIMNQGLYHTSTCSK